MLREVRRLPLPKARLSIQPAGRTLVNLDTVFSTTPPAFDRTVTILDQRVHITATAARYTWHFGDGTTQATTSPGRPYPALDVTHQYAKAGETVSPRVDVTFTISYSVDGGPTQTLEQTVTTDGVATTLTTHEAVPVLVD
ncbi:PKD domain-containing protein [Mumia sp. DW29H23]|uniref:PKD domain-containing protein n=1 Tax=Mumia sp. DW29H23 TaxID=3421241 RepID=UPI003D690449